MPTHEINRMKKKLLIIAGAGSSCEFGIPTSSDIDKLLIASASRTYPLATDPDSNLYLYFRDTINNYYGREPKAVFRKEVNFEEVIYQINLLSAYISDPYSKNGTNALLTVKPFPDVLDARGSRKKVDGNVLGSLSQSLMSDIVDNVVDACSKASVTNAKEIAELGNFLAVLKSKFDIGLITLNYDNILTQSLPELYTGFDSNGQFSPVSVFYRKDWNFIYHLHGSIHFAMTGVENDMHGITWMTKPSKTHVAHATGRNTLDSIEGTSYPMSSIVAGWGKPNQIQRQPFRTYLAQLNKLVYEADSLLFLGYGFGDHHLNAVFSDLHVRPRPIVVVTWENNCQEPLPHRCDSWSEQLSRTLPCNPQAMSQVGHIAPAHLEDLKLANELEVSNEPDRPFAVWYNGMLAACRNPQKILAHLL